MRNRLRVHPQLALIANCDRGYRYSLFLPDDLFEIFDKPSFKFGQRLGERSTQRFPPPMYKKCSRYKER